MKLRRRSPDLRIDLAPLIDVVFLLLTFFVFSLVLMIRADVTGVRLPALGSGERAEPGPSVVVAVTGDGTISLDGEAVELEAVATLVRERLDAEPEAGLLIAVDEAAPAAPLLGLIARFREVGLEEFGMLERPAGAAAPVPGGPERSLAPAGP